MRCATLGMALAWLSITACDDGPAGAPVETTVPPISETGALIDMPPVVPPDGQVAMGPWDWGAPCRVPVDETIGVGDRQLLRSYTIDVTSDGGDGFVVSFDDVSTRRARGRNAGVTHELYRHLAVLADMRLGPDGRFVEFVDLDAALADMLESAGVDAPESRASVLVRQPVVTDTILDRTIRSWYGFWFDHGRLPLSPERLSGDRHRQRAAGPSLSHTETFAVARPADTAIELNYAEISESAGARIDVRTTVDPTNRRPSSTVFELDGFSAGGTTDFAGDDRRSTTFGWERAQGCE